MTEINASQRYMLRQQTRAIYDQIPLRFQKSFKSFANEIVAAIEDPDEDTDIEAIGPALVAYYNSPEGRGDYARSIVRLVRERIWLYESPEAWQDERGPNTEWERLA